ncbi:MAG TPA: transglutaminase-like domain-containing protein [Spirochaetota bacterium]|nr:transglutaminase-like domain-containing protein [Spirochaetota bacterium]
MDKNRELILLKKLNKNNIKNQPILYNLDSKSKNIFKNKFIVSTISILIVLSFLSSYIFFIKFPDLFNKLSYEKFLYKEMTIPELYKVITNRISYRYDKGDIWLTPKTIWDNRYGDCEDFSVIASGYLTYHNIENYIIGLSLPNNSTGHALVIVKLRNTFWVIDLTGAVENSGYKKFIYARNISDIIKKYTKSNALIYKIPNYNGEKKILGTVYLNK